jgi:hypothetical protein
VAQHVLDRRQRLVLLAEEMLRLRHHALADQDIGAVLGGLRRPNELSRQLQRLVELSIVDAAGPQAPKRPQPVIGAAEPLGELQRS